MLCHDEKPSVTVQFFVSSLGNLLKTSTGFGSDYSCLSFFPPPFRTRPKPPRWFAALALARGSGVDCVLPDPVGSD